MNTIVIYPPTINWNYMKQRPQQLMEQFGKHGHPVLYFDKHNADGPVVEEAAPNVYVIRHADFFIHQLYPQISQNHKKLLWTTWSRMITFADRVQADAVVYDCVDDFPDWEDEEQALADRADVVFATANALFEKMRRLVPDKPISLVPNGCDWEHFAPVAVPTYHQPDELYHLPRTSGPTIGYVGAWAPWVNEEWITYLADRMPEAQILIVGPQLRENPQELPPNIHLLGMKSYEELPYILSYLDICIIPFRLNRITVSTNPIKAYEFLAAGKHIVASCLPELQELVPYVSLAETQEDFVLAIQRHLTEITSPADTISPSERSKFANQFSWEQRYFAIDSTLQEALADWSSLPAAALPSGEVQLPELQHANYFSTSFPLHHCTMNSFYAERNLRSDPVLVGQMDAGEYQCLLKPPMGVQVPDSAERVYLDFECNGLLSTEAELTISFVTHPWYIQRLTYNNQPPRTEVHTYALQQQHINETISLDMTDYVPRTFVHWPSIHLSGNQGILRLSQPRITFVTKDGHQARKG